MEQQFVPPIQINFTPEHKNEMFGVEMARAEEMVNEFSAISKNAIINHKEYFIKGTGEHEGCVRLDDARVLKEYLCVAKNLNEWLYTLYSANPMMDNIRDYYERRSSAFIDVLEALTAKG